MVVVRVGYGGRFWAWVLVVAFVLAGFSLSATTHASQVPNPGHLFVENGLQPSGDACAGEVEARYAFRPIDYGHRYVLDVRDDCSIEVLWYWVNPQSVIQPAAGTFVFVISTADHENTMEEAITFTNIPSCATPPVVQVEAFAGPDHDLDPGSPLLMHNSDPCLVFYRSLFNPHGSVDPFEMLDIGVSKRWAWYGCWHTRWWTAEPHPEDFDTRSVACTVVDVSTYQGPHAFVLDAAQNIPLVAPGAQVVHEVVPPVA